MRIIESYEWPITVKTPHAGTVEDEHFTAVFRVRTTDEILAHESGEVDGSDFMRATLIGWSGIEDADGRALAVSDANKEILVKHPHIRAGLFRGYRDSLTEKGPAGN